MEHVAAYIMLTKAQREVTAESMKSLFRVIDAPVEEETIDLFLSKVSGNSMEEIMARGTELMSSFAVAAPAAASATPEAAAPAESKKEAEPEEDFDIFAAF